MPRTKFFKKKEQFDTDKFNSKLLQSIALIEKNDSIISSKVFHVLQTGRIKASSFIDISKPHFFALHRYLKNSCNRKIPTTYPPTPAVIQIIESSLRGIIIEDKCIYINSTLTPNEICLLLIHEFSHHLNCDLFDKDAEKHGDKYAIYKDEIRSHSAEIMFTRNMSSLYRSDIRQVYKDVHLLYPDLCPSKEDEKDTGYVPAFFDF